MVVTTASSADDDKQVLEEPENAADFRYTSCYCEENIFHLCKTLSGRGLAYDDASDLFVVFISNSHQQVPFWCQRNSSRENGFCVWDYHVICVQKRSAPHECLVWDLDADVSLPVILSKYAAEVLRPDIPLGRKNRRLFRVIKAPLFLRCFASDRRHMRKATGVWLATPPPFDCIIAEDGEEHNLPQYNTITEDLIPQNNDLTLQRLQEDKLGVVLPQDKFLELFNLSDLLLFLSHTM